MAGSISLLSLSVALSKIKNRMKSNFVRIYVVHKKLRGVYLPGSLLMAKEESFKPTFGCLTSLTTARELCNAQLGA